MESICCICYEEATQSNLFFSNPCRCKGTMNYHYSCLAKTKQECGGVCKICKANYASETDEQKQLDEVLFLSATQSITPSSTEDSFPGSTLSMEELEEELELTDSAIYRHPRYRELVAENTKLQNILLQVLEQNELLQNKLQIEEVKFDRVNKAFNHLLSSR